MEKEILDKIAALLGKKGCFMFDVIVTIEEEKIGRCEVFYQLPPEEGKVSITADINARKRTLSGQTLEKCLEQLEQTTD